MVDGFISPLNSPVLLLSGGLGEEQGKGIGEVGKAGKDDKDGDVGKVGKDDRDDEDGGDGEDGNVGDVGSTLWPSSSAIKAVKLTSEALGILVSLSVGVWVVFWGFSLSAIVSKLSGVN